MRRKLAMKSSSKRAVTASSAALRYAVYDPNDPRKGTVLADPVTGQIILGEGRTITLALSAAAAALFPKLDPAESTLELPSGSVVWDRTDERVAYRVP